MTKEKIKDNILSAGVKNLKEFGYSEVNKENILSDAIYSAFFQEMLNDNLGQSTGLVDEVIEELLKEIGDNPLN